MTQLGNYFHFAFKNWPVVSYAQSSIRQNTQFGGFLLISGSIVVIARQREPAPFADFPMLPCLVFACSATLPAT
ncbi:hypothetical protein LJR029_007019 [Caballeronia sp. LjRoot29]